MEPVVPLERASAADEFGGKASQLARLVAIPGVRVPPGFAIANAVFRAWIEAVLPPAQRPERLVTGPARERRADRLAAIRERLLNAPLPADAWARIAEAYRALGQGVVAVRSSALHEDAREASAAGLQETLLGVDGEEALGRAVRECLASLFRERALSYLARRGAGRAVGMAAVVQRLVPADTAGVLFTVDPVGHEPGVMLVEAARGLGSTVVDGALAPDVYRIARDTGAVRASSVGDKRFALLVRGGALERVALSREEAARPALGAAELAALSRAGAAIEAAMGAGRDIEWAFAAGELWVLQSRPIVGVARDDSARQRWLWSNVNVGEALPGVATPLTWSIAAAFSETGFRRAFGALGCKLPPDAELVGSFHGRIYLNLTQFMEIAAQVPALNPRMLLEFGGGGGLEVLEQQVQRGSWLKFLPRAPVVALRFVAENAGLASRLEEFERDFARERREFEARPLSRLTLRELAQVLEGLEGFLDRTGAVMLTCASGSLSSIVALRGILRAFVPGDAPRLERELLTGAADLESAAPGIALVHIAELARREPEAAAALSRGDPSQLGVDSLPAGGPTRRAFDAFLRAYGYRAAREAELATPRWREAPQMLFAALQAQLEHSDSAPLERVDRQSELRAAAEREVDQRLPPPARAAFRHLIARTQRFVRLRERMRARVTEVLGYFRTVALEASARIAAREPAAGTDAAFFLHLDELRAFLKGELLDVSALVAGRRADYARDVARPDPPASFVGSPPPVAPAVVPEGDRLTGVAASPGCVVGTVRVLRDPAEGAALRPGEVLVAPVADVGWTPLFLVAAAVVTELGGALSHASLVAREYGVPAVVNVAGVRRALATGDRVRVDGDRGVVEILARAARGNVEPGAAS